MRPDLALSLASPAVLARRAGPAVPSGRTALVHRGQPLTRIGVPIIAPMGD